MNPTDTPQNAPAESDDKGVEKAPELPAHLSSFVDKLTSKLATDDSVHSSRILTVSDEIKEHISNPQYFGPDERDLLIRMTEADIDRTLSQLTEEDYGPIKDASALRTIVFENDMSDTMERLRNGVFAKLFETIEARESEEEITSARDSLTGLKTSFALLADGTKVDAATKQKADEIFKGIDETSSGDLDVVTAKFGEASQQLQELLSAYKTSRITELRGKGVSETSLTSLNAIVEPNEFFEKSAEQLTLAEATPAPETTTVEPEKSLKDRALDDVVKSSEGVESPTDFLDNLMKKGSFIGPIIVTVLTMLSGSKMASFTDKIIENLDSTETREVFRSLDSGHFRLIAHKAADEKWKTLREHKPVATAWLENDLRVDGNAVGKNEDLMNSLLNTEFTIAKFKNIAQEGTNISVIEEEDVPPEFEDDVPVIQALYETILPRIQESADHDNKTLAEFIATEMVGTEDVPAEPALS